MRRALTALTAAAMVMTLACSDSPQPPTTPSTPTTVTPTVPQVREVTIIGAPANVQIGGTAQLRAVSRADDGLQDVTAQAAWQSSDSGVCAVSSGGLVEGKGAGTATLTATYSGVAGTASLACGFAITAIVHENEPTTSVMLAGARVEVAGGPLDGRTFETDPSGRVTLPPVAAPGFALYVKKPGYDDRRLEIFELPRQVVVDVAIMPEPVLQFEDGGTCPLLAGSLRHRFAPRREGRVRVTVSGQGTTDLRAVFANVSPTDFRLQVSSPGLSQKELVLRPGDFTLEYYAALCPPGTPWRVQLEYPR